MTVETKPDAIVQERANSTRSVLSLQLRKRFQEGDRAFDLDVELELPAGITILFGPSGAGKTTVLDCIAGLTIPDSGALKVKERVLFNGENAINIPPQNRRVGYVLQDLALFPH